MRVVFNCIVLLFVLGVSLTPGILPTVRAQSDCPQPRLTINEDARVTPGAPNRVRDSASTSGQLIGEIPGGAIFRVLEGPVCDGGFLWWRVDYNGLTGWTAEGNQSAYFVEPVTQEATSTATPEPAASTGCDMDARLEIGREGKTTSNTPSRLRDQAGTSGAQVGQINAIDTFTILEGPVCADGIQWWRVDNGGVVGWTAEGVNGEYLLEMLAIVPTPTPAYVGLPNPVAVTWSADGERIAVGTDDGLYLFDAQDYSAPPVQMLAGIKVFEALFSPTDTDIIALSQREGDDYSAYVYDLETERSVFLIASNRPISPARSLSFASDGVTLGYSNAGVPVVVNYVEGDYLHELALSDWTDGELAYMGASNVALSPDGKMLGMDDGRVLWVPVGGDGALFKEFDRDVIDAGIVQIKFNMDNTQLLAADVEGNLQMWDIETGKRTSFIRGQRSTTSNRIYDAAFHPDGSVVATAEGDPHAVVRIFNARTLQSVNAFNAGTESSYAWALAFNPDGSQLAVIVDDRVVILETETYTPIAELVLARN